MSKVQGRYCPGCQQVKITPGLGKPCEQCARKRNTEAAQRFAEFLKAGEE